MLSSLTPADKAGILAITLALSAGSALAGKPPWAGKGVEPSARESRTRAQAAIGRRFGVRERVIVRDHFVHQMRGGHCPPGLVKKNNSCRPPGLQRSWRVGERLPDTVVVYDLPPRLTVEIGLPPPGHRLVRVASDILMIAVGTGLVVDAIADLGRM